MTRLDRAVSLAIGVAVYGGCGWIAHRAVIGPAIDWNSAASWAALLLWPIGPALALAGLGVAMALVVAAMLLVAAVGGRRR